MVVGEKKTNESESDENEDEPPTKVAKKSSEGPSNPTKNNSLRYDRYDHWVCTMTFKVAAGAKIINAIKQFIHTVQSATHIFAVFVIVTASKTIIIVNEIYLKLFDKMIWISFVSKINLTKWFWKIK